MKTYRIWSTKDPSTRAIISNTPLENVLVIETQEETTIQANNLVHAYKALLDLSIAYECLRGGMSKEIAESARRELQDFKDLVSVYIAITLYDKNK